MIINLKLDQGAAGEKQSGKSYLQERDGQLKMLRFVHSPIGLVQSPQKGVADGAAPSYRLDDIDVLSPLEYLQWAL
jgi:hypothetical protein